IISLFYHDVQSLICSFRNSLSKRVLAPIGRDRGAGCEAMEAKAGTLESGECGAADRNGVEGTVLSCNTLQKIEKIFNISIDRNI
ncbi:MAG: hypothetical protein J5817_10765, partial [Treponema sp.]|nr:hypothetical protein [Treponema sp.]